MNVQKEMTPGPAEDAGAADLHTPRPMTLAENAILTVKVLALLGLVGVALWGINVWNALR
jgi:hypothetical protein